MSSQVIGCGSFICYFLFGSGRKYAAHAVRQTAGCGGARGEEVVIVQGAVELATDFGGLGAKLLRPAGTLRVR
jgi:hypothetical protein